MARRRQTVPVAHVPGGDSVSVLEHVRILLAETDRRFMSVHTEKDLRDQQRYDAQTKAVEAALAAQQSATQTAFSAAEKAVQAALLAAKEAVIKAEIANEKRLDGVNEFRKSYQDLITLLQSSIMPRPEIEQRLNSIIENVEARRIAIDERLTREYAILDAKLAELRGSAKAGANALWGYILGGVGLLSVIISLFVNLGGK